jgi:hypothetical protein
MSNKAIPIRKTPLKPGVLATAHRTLLLMRFASRRCAMRLGATIRPTATDAQGVIYKSNVGMEQICPLLAPRRFRPHT